MFITQFLFTACTEAYSLFFIAYITLYVLCTDVCGLKILSTSIPLHSSPFSVIYLPVKTLRLHSILGHSMDTPYKLPDLYSIYFDTELHSKHYNRSVSSYPFHDWHLNSSKRLKTKLQNTTPDIQNSYFQTTFATSK